MQLLSTPAIVLRAHDYGESDRIVTFLTRDGGKLSGIAKGAKRSQRRFAGALGLFCHVTLDYRHRPSAELAFLERAVLIRPWKSILDSLERFAAATHVVEVADKMTVEHEVGDELYSVVLAALARIDAAEPGPATLRLFELATLAACGYRAELASCVVCRGSLLNGGGAPRLAPASGGAACARCAPRDDATTAVSPSAIAHLASMQEALARPGVRVDAGALLDVEAAAVAGLTHALAREMAAALAALLAPHLRGRLRSAAVLGPILGRAFDG
ncbi:MAG TPA: DNA repair protein RecO [Candidatus Binatia bacterium]|nr:DNA repair protein RecO [Candidatus Binatia bacterium]